MLSTPAGGVQPLLYYCTNSPLTDDKLKRSQLTSVVSRRVVVQKNEKVPEKNLPAALGDPLSLTRHLTSIL